MIQVPPFHTADEMRNISDLAHRVEGAVLGLAAVVALAQATGRYTTRRARLAWPALILAAGVFLLAYLLLPHHGPGLARAQWAFVFGDPQQRQHLALALLVTLGGAAELVHRTGRVRGPVWALAWPTAAALVGVTFAVHTQHGTGEAVDRAVLIHRVLGALLIATGALKAAEVRWAARVRWLAFPWTLTLLAGAALLALYREPEGAYTAEHGHGHESSAPARGNPPR
jgi:hypothetical protein